MFIVNKGLNHHIMINPDYIQLIKMKIFDDFNEDGKHLYHAIALCSVYGGEKLIDIWQICTSDVKERDQEVEWFYEFIEEAINKKQSFVKLVKENGND